MNGGWGVINKTKATVLHIYRGIPSMLSTKIMHHSCRETFKRTPNLLYYVLTWAISIAIGRTTSSSKLCRETMLANGRAFHFFC
ncbi:Uncharacterized protein TCM_042201 [Theobroma cacao]|uniref:Uncharacterized protein n=1 Tax=Theobroma cacao TaxID=3641 RepID=A0A061H0D2_THECC|nr:Uncharacterized protein TCM_042201 [Theobroma cacao]